MKKYLLFSLIGLMTMSFIAKAQKSSLNEELANSPVKTFVRAYVPNFIKEDKTEVIEITGINGASFSVSNTADGSTNSYNHALRITIPLITTSKSGSYQLVFYSEVEKMPYATLEQGGVTSIYYPVSVYDGMKEKLEQAIAAKKKVKLNIVLKTTGYREGTITF